MNENNNQYNAYTQNQQYSPQRIQTKNKFLTFCFALIPGAGQMYQGLAKKGISIMTLFFGVIASGILLYIPVINFALPIIWFYSFFDAINRINYSLDELKATEDSYIINLGLEKNDKLSTIFKDRHVLFGWVIVIIGVYALLNTVVFKNYDLMSQIDRDVYEYISGIVNLIPKLIIPIICLFIGFKLIKISTKKQENIPDPNINNQGE